MDELHLHKISMADEVFILNVDGYIGESTKRELAYARSRGIDVRFLWMPDLDLDSSCEGPNDDDIIAMGLANWRKAAK